MRMRNLAVSALVMLGIGAALAVACGGQDTVVEKVVVQTVIVKEQVPGEKVVETVIVKEQVPGEKVVQTVVVEKVVIATAAPAGPLRQRGSGGDADHSPRVLAVEAGDRL